MQSSRPSRRVGIGGAVLIIGLLGLSLLLIWMIYHQRFGEPEPVETIPTGEMAE
ncbi:MAG: hypothetical protein Q7P63_07980 [Verrucomicrobiota bacterium JB022]|nr:hypothetical protein [Verrucomicrobiota bacterium JB022]